MRRRLYVLAKRYGSIYLYKRLKKKDPETANNIHPNDLRRIVRGLEILHLEGLPSSILKKNTIPLEDKFNVRIFGLTIERSRLYERLDRRVDEMFGQGIVEEVKALCKKRLSQTAKQALGYKEIKGYLDGRYSIEEAKRLLKRNTRRFAKRQLTWFRKDKRIRWVEMQENIEDTIKEILWNGQSSSQ